jgi:hypothetical protein
MARGKAAFQKVSSSQPVAPLPDFPRLPQCLKRNKNENDLLEIEQYEQAVEEFFKKQKQIGL